MAEAARLLRGLFLVLQAFLQSSAKKFVVLIHSREDTETLAGLPAEGMLGLFLSAAQEYPVGPVSHPGNRPGYRPGRRLGRGSGPGLPRGGDDASGWPGLHFGGAGRPVGLQWSGKS